MPTPLPPQSVPQRLIARIITVNGVQFGLLAAQPNWATEIKVKLELPTDVSKEAITMQESRRNFAQSARYKMEWTSYLPSARDATELRIFLTRIYEIPILVPLWPDVCELAANAVAGQRVLNLVDLPARFGSTWIVTDETFTTWDVVAVSTLDIVNQQIHLTTFGITRAYPKGTLLYPAHCGAAGRTTPARINHGRNPGGILQDQGELRLCGAAKSRHFVPANRGSAHPRISDCLQVERDPQSFPPPGLDRDARRCLRVSGVLAGRTAAGVRPPDPAWPGIGVLPERAGQCGENRVLLEGSPSHDPALHDPHFPWGFKDAGGYADALAPDLDSV